MLPVDMDVLRSIAHHAAEDRDKREGWCRWSVDSHPWDAYRPLLAAGLIERTETWKDVLLRPTDAGWALLAGDESAPTKEWIAQEIREGRGLDAIRRWDERKGKD